MAADRCLDRRPSTGERHVHQVELEGQPEQLAAQMRRRSDAGTGKAVFAGIVPDELHQFRQRLGRHLRVDHHDIRRNRNQRHRREILDRIIRHLGVEAGVHDEAGADRHDGVAVRRHAGDLAGRGVAAGAADVLDEELLAEIVGKLLRHDAGDGIGRSAGGKADHDAHRPARIALRRCRHDAGQQPRRCQQYAQNRDHGALPNMFVGAIIGEAAAPGKGLLRWPAAATSSAAA